MVTTRKGKYERKEQAPEKANGTSDTGLEGDDGSDSDAPAEISSKPGPDILLVDGPEQEMSLFEQVTYLIFILWLVCSYTYLICFIAWAQFMMKRSF
ncbi:unnamed protein product [Strongylus vulgaris]|uniref:Uncharacterized protein n=1 Tax=Strongylus vulgaris TaxID=40348 RepID=A0A3P7JFZ3_STRVU|nr:unnamed protein product [Strongylus vulgaris]